MKIMRYISSVLFMVVFAFGLSSCTVTNKVRLDIEKGMSLSERVKDFDDICSFLETQLPDLYSYELLYNISYDDVKVYYKEKIKNSLSDFDYYAAVYAFMKNIPSSHLDLQIPDYESLRISMLAEPLDNFEESVSYWENTVKNEAVQNGEREDFVYYNGEYISASTKHKVLVSIDSVSIDEYIKICPLSEKIMYDHVRNKPFRGSIALYRGGESIAEFMNSDGNIYTESVSVGSDMDLKYYFSQVKDNISEDNDHSIYYFKDDSRNLVYYDIKSFSDNGIISFIEDSCNSENVIIDLRSNYGGQPTIAYSVLGLFTDKSITASNTLKLTESGYEQKYFQNIDSFEYYSENGGFYCKENYEIKGRKPACLYVLIGSNTSSAADNFVKTVKDNKLGIIIGCNNTGGEASGYAHRKIMNRSGLYFMYTPMSCVNYDGTSNSVYGTSPDIYVEKYTDDPDYINSNDNIYTYEKRLKWDNVLIKTLELIKEGKNDKGNNTADE